MNFTECFVQELEDLRSEGGEGRRQSQSQSQYDEVREVWGKYKDLKIIKIIQNYRGYLDDNYNSYDRESVKVKYLYLFVL